jgi:polyhydroxyalkanoate synthesis regulator phasin
MAEEGSRKDRDGDPLRDGIRNVAGVLGALKDAIEDTFDDLRERGDLSPERAREAAKSAFSKAQESFDDMRERVDFVPRKEFDTLRAEFDALRTRFEAHLAAAALGSETGAAGAGGGGGTGGGPGTGAGGSGGTGGTGTGGTGGSGIHEA